MHHWQSNLQLCALMLRCPCWPSTRPYICIYIYVLFFFGSEPWPSNLEDSPHVYLFSCFRKFRAFHSAAHSGTCIKDDVFQQVMVLSQAVWSSCPWKRWSMLAILSLLGGGFIFLTFHPYLGKRSNLTIFFKWGETNHQQVYILGGLLNVKDINTTDVLDLGPWCPNQLMVTLGLSMWHKIMRVFFQCPKLPVISLFFKILNTTVSLLSDDFPHPPKNIEQLCCNFLSFLQKFMRRARPCHVRRSLAERGGFVNWGSLNGTHFVGGSNK